MLSKEKIKQLNNSLENGHVPKEMNFYKEQVEGGFVLDWSKLDYNIKEKPKHDFDVFFDYLFRREM